MATIESAIRLNDMMTAPIRNIVNSMNMMLSSWEELESSTRSGLDMDVEGIRSELNQATIAVKRLDSAMQELEIPSMSSPVSQEPVQIPVVWQADNLEVFTNSGVERFQQEIQSANNMLNTLNRTQQEIANTATQTNLFPENMVADMNGMQTRLQAIQNRIRAIENNPLNVGSDVANAELEQLRGQLTQAVTEQQNLNRAIEQMDVSEANEAYLRLSNTVSNTERYIRDNTNEQGNFNRSIEQGAQCANDLSNQILGAVGAYMSLQSLGQLVNLSDSFTQTTARLNMINDGAQTTEELFDKIAASADRARANIATTADTVAKLSLNAGDAFSSNDETILFAENLNKLFAIAGTEQQSIASASLQLTQALGSGVLRGEEFNAVFEAAPNIMQTVADYMGVPIGQLRSMAQEGQITADVVKNALLSSTDEINTQFESMPMTWAQVWTGVMNELYMASIPLLELINVLANNWSVLEPIVTAVAVAVGLYTAALLINKAVVAGRALIESVHAASTMMSTGATFAATAAQHGFNAALLACPITWIIIAIIAVIAIIYAVIAAINKIQGTTISATGVILGVLTAAVSVVWNIFLTLLSLIIQSILVPLTNAWDTFANFFGNIFTDPIATIIRMFEGLANSVLGILNTIAQGIDSIFGSNLSGTVQGWMNGLSGKADELVARYGNGSYEQKSNLTGQLQNLLSDAQAKFSWQTSDAYNLGYGWGEGVEDTVGELFGGTGGLGEEYSLDNLIGGMNDIPAYDEIATNTGDTVDALEITHEDLKYLRDLAEQEVINRFTTAEIHVEMGGVNNTVNQNADLDGIIDYMVTGVQEAMERVAEGVHD